MPTPDELRAQAAQLLAKAQDLETPLAREDVARMFKAKQYAQIEQARLDGRLTSLLAGTSPVTEGN